MIVFHFDAIATPGSSTITRQPSKEGRRLWNSLFDTYRGRIAVTADYGTDATIISEWMKREQFFPSFIHVATDLVKDGSTARADALWWVTTNLGKPHWYIDIDADTCARALRLGIPSLLMAVPHFDRPEWHDDKKVRPWDVVVSELEAQAVKKTEMVWDEV